MAIDFHKTEGRAFRYAFPRRAWERGKDNKRLTPKLPGLELLELIRKDFIAKKYKLLCALMKDAAKAFNFEFSFIPEQPATEQSPFETNHSYHTNKR